jgi:hypothetical protein
MILGKRNTGKHKKKEVNMKQKSVWTVGLFLGLLTALSVTGMAQWRRPGTWPDPGLNLTDEQLAKIQEVRLAFVERIAPLRMQWQKELVNLDSLTMKGAGQTELEAANEALDKIEAELEKAYQDHRDEVRNLLNDEQRALFDRYGGLGLGLGWGANARWGMRPGWGRGFGPGWGPGLRQGYRFGWGPGMGLGFRGPWGRGPGRGYFCPWFRWR